jgi:hypothetical protein
MTTAECHPDREEIAIGLCAECLGEELRDQQEGIERAETRDCSSCGERRGLDQFYGKSGVCKACRRLARYGLTHPGYDILVEEQDGSCAICGASATECVLQVDHDHETDEVRGLLCGACNRAIGLLRDDLAIVRRAAKYLEAPPSTMSSDFNAGGCGCFPGSDWRVGQVSRE